MARSPSRPRRFAGRPWIVITAGAIACYVASYIAFSSWGQYVPRESGGGAASLWAPGEFYDFATGRWRRGHATIYAPMLWLDHWLWHRPRQGGGGG